MRRARATILVLLAAAIVAALVAFSGEALARPGGGESYSGGGGHGGSSDSGDGGAMLELVIHLIRLSIHYPKIGLPLLAIVIGFLLYSAYKKAQNKDWDSGPPVELSRAIDLAAVRRIDADFSQVVFEDFAARLFAAAHRARASEKDLAAVAPYIMPAAARALLTRAPAGQPVASVVVGAMRTFRVDIPDAPVDAQGRAARVRIGIEFEANVTCSERPGGPATRTYYSVESWLFGRAANARSKPPGDRTFPCPNCGAPWQASGTGTQVCASCGQSVDNGRFDWTVEQISLASIDERAPTLTEEVRERGTDLPTYHQRGFDALWSTLLDSDPTQSEEAIMARARMIFDQLNAAWSIGKLDAVRGLLSDGLYDSLTYWLEAYASGGLRNVIADARITRTAACKLVRDKHYDALTIRVWAKSKDYVVRRDNGALVRGSKNRDRAYSEYWTIIRSSQRRGETAAAATCGNCGAPLQVNAGGACEHCGTHLTRGELDWVLSKIEQDDSYRG